jgi:hypothetical protein
MTTEQLAVFGVSENIRSEDYHGGIAFHPLNFSFGVCDVTWYTINFAAAT